MLSKTRNHGMALLEAAIWSGIMLAALLGSFKIYQLYQTKTSQVERDFYEQWEQLGRQ